MISILKDKVWDVYVLSYYENTNQLRWDATVERAEILTRATRVEFEVANNSLEKEINEWLWQNTKFQVWLWYDFQTYIWLFENSDEALSFKLTWYPHD